MVESNSLAPFTLSHGFAGFAPQNIEIDPYGRIVTSLFTDDFRLYSPDEVVIQESTNLPAASIGSTETRGLRISSDGLRAMGNGYLVDLAP